MESSWCCLRPKKCTSREQNQPHFLHQCHQCFPHRRPASPQTGGRGCGQTLVEASQEWSRSRREGEGTVPHLRGSWRHYDLRPSLALRQETIADIKSTNKYIFRIKYIYTSNHFNSFCLFVLLIARKFDFFYSGRMMQDFMMHVSLMDVSMMQDLMLNISLMTDTKMYDACIF